MLVGQICGIHNVAKVNVMRNVDRDLYDHLAKCLGLEDRKITKLNIYCDVGEPIRIVTSEIVNPRSVLPEQKIYELCEIRDGTHPTT